jgi:ubiquinone/menaquinone biosynthesis C-methylase UbiE
MLEIASRRLPNASVVRGDALRLPFADASFERVATMSFHGHLEDGDRRQFLAEARRVADELVVVDAALRPDVEPEQLEERALADGSRWTVYKRYFAAEGLRAELGGGEILYAGRWFVAVRSPSA